jgi:hypothetical protein
MECLTIAKEHAAACGDQLLLAEVYLELAHLEGARNDPAKAVEYVQRAQQLGGSIAFWSRLLLAYTLYRCV